MLTHTILPDGRLEVRNNGLILHTLTAPETFVLAANVILLHAQGALHDIATGDSSGATLVLAGAPKPAPVRDPMGLVRDMNPDAFDPYAGQNPDPAASDGRNGGPVGPFSPVERGNVNGC